LAIDAALEDVKSGRTLAVPEHLRDAHYKGAKKLGHGTGYNTRTKAKIILSRRIISARTKFITSPPSRAWKRKSRSAWKNGGRRGKGFYDRLLAETSAV
jgi:replication-associated recombination protein RarA